MNKYDVEYRRKVGCTIHAGILEVKAETEKNAKVRFLKEIASDLIGEYEILRIVPYADPQ